MPSDPASALSDIADHIILARLWISNLTSEEFKNDRKTFYAVTRCLEIISEATKRLTADMKERHKDIQWHRIKAAGNVYRHQYEDVLEKDVWDTVHEHLPPLVEFVKIERRNHP